MIGQHNTAQPHRFLDLFSALVWAFGWLVLTYTIATPAATIASSGAAFIAFFVGRQLSGMNLRTSTMVLGTLVLSPLLLSLADFPNRSPFIAQLFPGVKSLVFITDFFWWGLLAGITVGLLQFLSRRFQIFISIEVVIVALFMSTPFAAHRDGFINRPYFLIDPLWSRGYDPVPVLQALGVVIAVALILLTIGRATRRSSMIDVVLLVVLTFFLYAYLPQEAVRDFMADPPGASGLTGEAQEGEMEPPPPDGGGSGGGQEPLAGDPSSGESDDNPFPFESSEPNDPKPVAVVIFRDDYDPPNEYYYFRQTAFSQFNGFRLVKDTTGLADTDLFRRFPTAAIEAEPPPMHPYVPTQMLETRIALISSHTEPFALVKPLRLEPVPNPDPKKFERAFDVNSLVYTGDYSEILHSDLEDPRWSEEVKEHYLGYPDDDERYRELAEEIISALPEEYRDRPMAKAIAITLYLGENGSYTTRKRAVAGSEDPTADFLFGDLTGYCVHFSHAAVYLLRSVGVPARVGAGYAVESRDRRGSALMILSSRAHAWPEIWVDGLGWFPMDIAPQTYLDPPIPPPDYDLQSMLAEMARDEGEEYEQIEQFDLRKYLRDILEMFAAFLPWLIAGLLVLAYGLKLERRFSYLIEKDDQKVHALYKAALDKLYDAGFVRQRGQGRLSFAEEHRETLPSLTPLTENHLRLSFGKKGGSNVDSNELVKTFRSLNSELAEATPLWRRALGSLNPLSWYFTR